MVYPLCLSFDDQPSFSRTDIILFWLQLPQLTLISGEFGTSFEFEIKFEILCLQIAHLDIIFVIVWVVIPGNFLFFYFSFVEYFLVCLCSLNVLSLY